MKTTVPRWTPSLTISKREKMLLKRLEKNRRLFAMLRLHRRDLFDGGFQDELAAMYRDTGEGKVPVPPAQLAMVLLLQAYTGVSDADAVEMTVVDARWQMVLDVLGADEPAFSQGMLPAFRERMIRHDTDRRLLERTVELAKTTEIFDWKKLPKTLRLAVDSRPIEGAGRVEDTINLLGQRHAGIGEIEPAGTDVVDGRPVRRDQRRARGDGIPVVGARVEDERAHRLASHERVAVEVHE